MRDKFRGKIMIIYGLIKNVYDGYHCEWFYDIDTLQLFADKEKRDNVMKELESQIGKYEREYYYDFEVELQ